VEWFWRNAARSVSGCENPDVETSTIVVLHTATPDVREGVRRLAAGLSVPVREIPYAGAVGIEPEVLAALADSL